MVVADESRTDKTICLAVTPSLKAYGISGSARLFEVVQQVKEANRGRLHDAPGHRFSGKSCFLSELNATPGLEIDYLDKAPGIYSARFAGEDTSYDIKNRILLDRMEGVPDDQRSARFVCAVAAMFPDGAVSVVRETIEGQVAAEAEGENGFGYDPIFYVPEYGCTTAQMTPEQKNEVSHRGKALRAMKKLLEKKFGEEMV